MITLRRRPNGRKSEGCDSGLRLSDSSTAATFELRCMAASTGTANARERFTEPAGPEVSNWAGGADFGADFGPEVSNGRVDPSLTGSIC